MRSRVTRSVTLLAMKSAMVEPVFRIHGYRTALRDILTGLAILLIVALSAALAGPYFVDWTSAAGGLEQQLTRLAGVPVQISGPIDLKLLPTPRLKLEKVAASARRKAVRV